MPPIVGPQLAQDRSHTLQLRAIDEVALGRKGKTRKWRAESLSVHGYCHFVILAEDLSVAKQPLPKTWLPAVVLQSLLQRPCLAASVLAMCLAPDILSGPKDFRTGF